MTSGAYRSFVMAVDVIIEDERWRNVNLAGLAQGAAGATFSVLGIAGKTPEFVVLACDDARIAALNGDFRDKAAPTNVLSWPSEERGAAVEGQRPAPVDADELGDLALAFETCLREARAAEITLEAHATHLIVHGLLHLLGYDHERDGDGDLMEATEIEILERLDVQNPYE